MPLKQTLGSRAQVMHGTAKKTSGGLTKSQLKYNKQGKIVSKKASALAKKNNRLVKAGYKTQKGVFSGGMKGGGKTNQLSIYETGGDWYDFTYESVDGNKVILNSGRSSPETIHKTDNLYYEEPNKSKFKSFISKPNRIDIYKLYDRSIEFMFRLSFFNSSEKEDFIRIAGIVTEEEAKKVGNAAYHMSRAKNRKRSAARKTHQQSVNNTEETRRQANSVVNKRVEEERAARIATGVNSTGQMVVSYNRMD